MEQFYKGKVAVVTGASSGLGRDLAVELAKLGAKVVLASRNEDALRELASELGEENTLVCPMNVTDPEMAENLARRTVETWGSIDLLFNCAGVFQAAGFGSLNLESFRQTVEVNIMGTVHCLWAVIPYMRQQQKGSIVNLSSLAGRFPVPGSSDYSASKYAIAGLSNALRQELKHENIYLTAVYPSFVATPILSGHLKSVRESLFYRLTCSYSPQKAARSILKTVKNKKREVVLPRVNYLTCLFHNISPRLSEGTIGLLLGGWPRYDQPWQP